MYQQPSSSSSSPQKPAVPGGLTRYGSAPGSFLTRAVDSVIGVDRELSGLGSTSLVGSRQYFSGDSSSVTAESTCKVNSSSCDPKAPKSGGSLQRSYGLNEVEHGAGSLVRQRSSPAGFLSHLATENGCSSTLIGGCWTACKSGLQELCCGTIKVVLIKMVLPSISKISVWGSESGDGYVCLLCIKKKHGGFSITRGSGGYNVHSGPGGGHSVSRLKPQLSFTRQESLSQISEVSENVVEGIGSDSNHQNCSHSYSAAGFGMESWDNANSIVFSGPPSKQARNGDGDIYSCFNGLETQFSLPQTSLEIETVEKLLHIPEDSVPCKIRAKRGFATHPRSIAERERRTRISGKLKKLQDLVPNMDKQTSYADMLDFAVQHIKGLQNEVEKLRKEMGNCTCGCEQSTPRSWLTMGT
uniref:BHLH domain-containing protein n=1 Tax=Salix viminalis TaxID=40686 RepID=A0A6N2N4B2_SALVM